MPSPAFGEGVFGRRPFGMALVPAAHDLVDASQGPWRGWAGSQAPTLMETRDHVLSLPVVKRWLTSRPLQAWASLQPKCFALLAGEALHQPVGDQRQHGHRGACGHPKPDIALPKRQIDLLA